MHRNLSARGLRALLLAGVSAVSITAAEAADMYSGGLKDGPAYVPYNWTGFYAGTNSGGVVGTGQVADPWLWGRRSMAATSPLRVHYSAPKSATTAK